ncbi:MAG: hypothetical protein P4L48_03355 [Mycobacterium sp.]|nr:hypothetical protein [Mycobacterium sp.]HKI43098.1 hypothetical protein [Mycobacterium sp.]
MSREVLKVFCPRRHRVGTVRADVDGLLVDYSAEAWHNGLFGTRAVDQLFDDEAGELGGYCKPCKKPVQLDIQRLRAAALAGERDIQAPYGDTADRGWTDAGRPPMYPPGTTRHKTDPRSSSE